MAECSFNPSYQSNALAIAVFKQWQHGKCGRKPKHERLRSDDQHLVRRYSFPRQLKATLAQKSILAGHHQHNTKTLLDKQNQAGTAGDLITCAPFAFYLINPYKVGYLDKQTT